MPRPKSTTLKLKPGSCTLRLTPLLTLETTQKTSLLTSISNDITATFIYIAKAVEAGYLDPSHTEPINTILGIIRGTEIKQRKRLERRVEKYRRRLRRVRGERGWVFAEFKGYVHKVKRVVEGLRAEVRGLRSSSSSGDKQEDVKQ